MQNAKTNIAETSGSVNFSESDLKRFWEKVKKTKSCWLWTGSTRAYRYGSFRINGKLEAAHRISFLIAGNKITKEKPCVLHNCPSGDNGLCVNPSHLFGGTQAENIIDMERKERARHPKGEQSGMVKHPESVLRGEKNANAILTTENVIEIFNLAKSGEIGIKTKLASLFCVSRGLIGHIVNGRAWNHVTGLPRR
jgi:hypothetical protein